ncbi:DUF5906 domain-containing protein [Vibrio breoganii]|uniref:DNA primase family protein n=1 Tax=Vibrio breoganii TaxID=553239 RepID=UPI000CB5CA3A|nr:DUF5906 domain-containing protein [Vibrio breoganii]PMK33050.1 hypothetical protein BCU03_04655 [Vibrio breoganii]
MGKVEVLAALSDKAEKHEKRYRATSLFGKPNRDFEKYKASDKARLILTTYGDLVRKNKAGDKFAYKDGVWEVLEHHDIEQRVIQLFDHNETGFSDTTINTVISTLTAIAQPIGGEKDGIIGFSNGVLDINENRLHHHSQENFITSKFDVDWFEYDPAKKLCDVAPSFHKWLEHSSSGDDDLRQAILAGLYMILTKRHDWELFLEVTGKGGTGKSTYANLASLLSGNVTSSEMSMLDDPMQRPYLVNANLIKLPDQPAYQGKGDGIKKITGGDEIAMNPKNKPQFTAIIKAVIMVTNNEPMRFTERNGGIARRRVILPFNNVVPEQQRDPELMDKLRCEIPSIINYLLAAFTEPTQAKDALKKQAQSKGALAVKRDSDALYGFAECFKPCELRNGMGMGKANDTQSIPRRFIYHAYLSYLDAKYHKPKGILSVEALIKQLGQILKETVGEEGFELAKHRIAAGVKYNITLDEDKADWLPNK